MEAKRRRRCSDDQTIWTGGYDQWPWAMDCETLVPSALGQPGSTQGPPSLLKTLPGGHGTALHTFFSSRVKMRKKI